LEIRKWPDSGHTQKCNYAAPLTDSKASPSLPTVSPSSSAATLTTLTPTSIPFTLPTSSLPTINPTIAPSSITTYRNISTFAANGIQGFSGDNGLATNAQVNGVNGLSIDTIGNVYFADTENIIIRKVTKTSNIITTIAGNNVAGYSGDGGLATNAQLRWARDVVVDTIGVLLFLFFLLFFIFFKYFSIFFYYYVYCI
jgi:hypothetical protein